MSEVSGILVEQKGGVMTVQLNAPPMNPFGVRQVEALEELVPSLAADKTVRVIVIRGAGDNNFSVGANLKEGYAARPRDLKEFCSRRIQLFNAIENLEKPVIAAVRGYCLGGGCELALACHFRIADHTARFGLPEIDLGVAPMWGGSSRLLRLAGRAHALDLLLRGRHVDAAEAFRMGLVNTVCEPDSFDESVSAIATELTEKHSRAVAAIIRVINRNQDLPLNLAIENELEEFRKLSETQDMSEGISAKLEKRKPRFAGG